MGEAVHEVYGIAFARNETGRRGRYFLGAAAEPADEPKHLAYYTWVLRSDAGDVVVDVGFTAETNKHRPRILLESPSAALTRLGTDAADVRLVVLSHFHNDHVGDVEPFANAEFVAQRAEFEFWTSEYAFRGELGHHAERDDIDRLARLHDDGRLRLIDGDAELVPGVSVHHTGGHTPGTQVVRVATASGPVVLAADASHFFENVEEDHAFAVHTDLIGIYRTFDRMRELAGPDGVVVAGHDPDVLRRFPAVPGLEGRAVRIA
ncbi:N-acyl homoserine lactonase family protein [Salinibacterium sp. ZJ70]|uniref:N-acyl homoserine lactonase family protein n=1 Tax=Salinibacterium sp. ZJ70 TaxID=2708084 RepID=UPI001420B500|nr:N-acyl homoserine lactonase family protein [Salinibacterium sp. ZJ70]